MSYLERLDAPGKPISQLSIGETFTSTGAYTPSITPVYKVQSKTDIGLIICEDEHGWHRYFDKDAIVYPIH